MKNIFKLLIVVTLILTLLVGCTSPMKAYKEAIDKADIEASLVAIEASATTAYDAFGDFFDTVDMTATDVSAFEGFTTAKDLLDEYITLVDDTIVEVEAIDTSKKDVKAANEHLMNALNKYKEMGAAMDSVVTLATQLFAIMANVNASNEQLNTLGDPSEDYSNAVYTFMLSNSAILEELSGFDYNAMLSTGDLNAKTLLDMKANVDTLLKGLADMPMVTDIDKTYNDLLLGMYGSMNEMMEMFANNVDTVKIIASFEGDGREFIQTGIDEANASIEEWKDAMNK